MQPTTDAQLRELVRSLADMRENIASEVDVIRAARENIATLSESLGEIEQRCRALAS